MASGSGNTPRPAGAAGSPSPATATQLAHLRPPSHPAAVAAGSPFQGLFQTPPPHRPQSSFQIHMGSASGLAGSSPSFVTPGMSIAAKRPPQKPPVRPQITPGSIPSGSTAAAAAAANASALKAAADLTPAARRKKRKLPEKQLPDRVAALLPESALYTQLLEFESRVDAALARKKLDIQEALKNPPSIQKTLRIYIFNTYANQVPGGTPPGPPAAKNATSEPPSWSLKIVGRILDEGADPDPAAGPPKANPLHPKFSSFFKRVTIALDPALYPENPMIIWENARSSAPHEGFEVRRKGDKEFIVNIRFEMNYTPEKFRLSPALTDVLGIEVDTRARVLAALWQYVKAKKLQNPSDPSIFSCDPPLRKVFGEEKLRFAVIPQKISQHLSPPQPISLEHKIRLSGAAGSACYDVLVDVPFPLQKEMSSFLANTEKHKDIEACDEVICASIKKIHEHRRRRAFFLGFSQSPVEFIDSLIASQGRDLKLVAGEASRNAEMERRADFYSQPWVEDAVIRYLNRKPAGGDGPPGT